MIKLKISSQKPWLETLLSQYFNELEISNDADISILEDTSSFTINTSSLSQSWRLNKPISILLTDDNEAVPFDIQNWRFV